MLMPSALTHLPLFFQGELELLRRAVLIFAQQLCNPRKSGRRSRTCMTSHILLDLRSNCSGNSLKKPLWASFEQGPAHFVSFLRLVFDHPVPRNLCTVPLDLHTCVLACLIYVRNCLICLICVRNLELVTFGLNSCSHVVVLTSPPPEHVWIAVQLPGHNSRWIQSGYMEGFIIT